MQNTGKGLSVASLVLGIVSAVLAWFYLINIAALVCGIIGIVCAAKGKKRLWRQMLLQDSALRDWFFRL